MSATIGVAREAVPSADRSPRPVAIRGGSFTLLVLRLPDPKDPLFFGALADKVAQAPNFFRQAPVVIDLQDLAEAPTFNMAELGRRLRQHGLIPVGVQNGTEEQNRLALNAGWTIFAEGREVPLRSTREATSAREPEVVEDGGDVGPRVAATLALKPIRSGRQVYAREGDLVVLAGTSPGAELLADGHIHVYGALRGRALAGVSGDTSARIFCQSLEAELLSIAGYWVVRENIPETLIGKAVQVCLEGERVVIRAFP